MWLNPMGIVLQLVGILLLAADYFGFGQVGYSPLRWWIDRLNNGEADALVLWSRQTLLTVGVSTLVMGLLLQFLVSWAYESLGRQLLCMFPLLASAVGGDVSAVSHNQAQEHPLAVGCEDLQPHEQNASHRTEDVLVTDSSMLEHPAIGEAPLVQESAPQATTLRERACRDILVRVNAGSGQEVIACQCSDALPLAHTVFTEKIRHGQRPGHDHRRDVHQPMGFS